MHRKGYKNLIDDTAITWHLNNLDGGIRDKSHIKMRDSYAQEDEKVFAKKMRLWGVKPTEYSIVVLDSGIGDHYAFKSILPDYFMKNKDKKHLFHLCYPEVFKELAGREDVIIGSIADASFLGGLDPYNIYKWMWDRNWGKSVIKALRQMYVLPDGYTHKNVLKGCGDTIVISPYSKFVGHPKSYPYWADLVRLLKENTDYKIIQIGALGEKEIDLVDEYYFGHTFKEIEGLVAKCAFWVSVDNFLPHMINCMQNPICGAVIFGLSDPCNFGYSYNTNILKSRDFLRVDQFNIWSGVASNNEVFLSATDVLQKLKHLC
jgi:hypothetical protein